MNEALQATLGAAARQVPAEAWSRDDRMAAFLLDEPALGAMFDSFFIASVDGRMLARVEKGAASSGRLNIADREHFVRAMARELVV